MGSADFLNSIETEQSNTNTKTKSKKRKWREIEAIKERYRLKQELCEMDVGLEAEFEGVR